MPLATAKMPEYKKHAEFTEISELAMKRAGHRADQAALVAGAEYLATQYRELYGQRVEQILGYLEETDDVDTFKRRLTDMLADLPESAVVEKLRDATWHGRLMGLDRGRAGRG